MKMQKTHYATPLSPLPRVCTSAAHDFFSSWHEINDLLEFLLHLVGSSDRTSDMSHKVLIETEDDPGKKLEMEKGWKQRKKAVDILREKRQLLLEIILVRHIENYLNYLSSLLFEIFTKRPETLRSSEKVELSELLKHSTMDDVVREVAEKRVASLSYSSLRDLADFFSERFGLSIATPSLLEAICEATEIRNISVHNRCIINERFVNRTGCDHTTIGQQQELFIGHLDRLLPVLAEIVKELDKSARNKMKLKAVRSTKEK